MKSLEIIYLIKEIYKRFDVVPPLQMHMAVVAGVAELILSAERECNKDDVIAALLLHDLGNIVKFKLEGEPADWKQIKQETIAKYGSVDHEVTDKMIRELGANDRVSWLISEMGFENLLGVVNSNDLELKICLYSDLRVSPNGVVSLVERFVDLRKRYKGTSYESRYGPLQEERAFLLEQQIFKGIFLQPFEIT